MYIHIYIYLYIYIYICIYMPPSDMEDYTPKLKG